MPEVVSTENYQGETVHVLKEHDDMRRASTILVQLPLNEGQVMLLERCQENMEAYSHEPRPWIVAFVRTQGHGDTKLMEFSDITFHPRVGGPAGALTRMGEIIEEYTGGRY